MTEYRASFRTSMYRYAEAMPYEDLAVSLVPGDRLFKDVKIPVATRGSLRRLFDTQPTEEGKLAIDTVLNNFVKIAPLDLPFIATKITSTPHSNDEFIVHAYPNFDTTCELKDQALMFKRQTRFNGHVPKSVALGIFATEESAINISKTLSDRFIGTNPDPICIFGAVTRES